MRKNTALAVGIGLAFLLAFLTAAIVRGHADSRAASDRIGTSFERLAAVRALEFAILDTQRAGRSILLFPRYDETYIITPTKNALAAHRHLNSLFPKLEQPLSELEAIIIEQNRFWTDRVGVARTQGEAEALEILTRGGGNYLIENALRITRYISQIEAERLHQHQETSSALNNRLDRLYVGLLVLLVLMMALGVRLWYVSQQTASDRDRAIERARDRDRLVEAGKRQRLLLNELNHRVKNTLVTVQSLALQSKLVSQREQQDEKINDALERCYERFETRLLALSGAHDLLTNQSWEAVDLDVLIRETLRPLVDLSRVGIYGPSARVCPNVAVTINLLFYELTTNAIKYGALSTDSGWIRIRWWEEKGSLLRIVWRETGGPPVVEPTSRGFGSKLIEKAAMREVVGKSKMIFDPSGVICEIEIPLSDKIELYEK
jgi:two-component sensor histidine kinase/CHASE3 domain sensor protein